MKIGDWLKISDYKKIRPKLIFVLICGIALLILSNNIKKVNAPASSTKVQNDEVSLNENTSNDFDLKRELEKILSSVEGVGETNVFISYETSEEKIALKDIDSKGSEQTVLIGEKTKSEPFIYKSNSPKIGGVIIVAEEILNSEVKNMIIDTVSSVLSIPIHKVKVLKSRY